MEKLKFFEEELTWLKDNDPYGYLHSFITKFLVEAVSDEFFIAPASSSNKYHNILSNQKHGLVYHTKAAVRLAQEMFILHPEWSTITKCEIVAALLLHDTFKSGHPWTGWTKFDHPLVAADQIMEFFKNNFDADPTYNEHIHSSIVCICRLIKSHMGQWHKRVFEDKSLEPIVLPLPASDAEHYVHLCDYLASRKSLYMDLREPFVDR